MDERNPNCLCERCCTEAKDQLREAIAERDFYREALQEIMHAADRAQAAVGLVYTPSA